MSRASVFSPGNAEGYNPSIGVIGGGTVGFATARCYMEWGAVMLTDLQESRSTHTFAEVVEHSDIIFLCLPTPAHNGHGKYPGFDLSAIETVCGLLKGCDKPIALKSTVPIGTTSRLRAEYSLPNMVHHPEFLTARCAVTDAQLPARLIVGAPPCLGLERMLDLLRYRFQYVPIQVMTPEASEAVKLILNSFFAVKVAFFNEAYTLCEKLRIDWRSVLPGVLSDGRISYSHTRVPGPDGKRGFGGGCLRKDLQCLIDTMEDAGLTPYITRAAHDRNMIDRPNG